MSGRQKQREKVEAALAAHLLETGLAKTSLRQLATAAGVSDRMLLYYFDDKAEALACATQRVAAELAAHVAGAMKSDGRLSPIALMREAVAVTTRPDTRPYMRLWVEIVAAAARNEAPFAGIADQVMAGFQQWAEQHLDIDDPEERESVAAMVIALIDGIAIVDICRGASLAGRAAGALSILAESAEKTG